MGLEPGTAIGGYTILSQLGSGAMGVVYRAVDDGGNTVAFKILRSNIIDKEELRIRLVREAAALQKVKHPAVAAMLDAETESDETFIVTELIEGPTLDSFVADHGPLPPSQLLHTAQRLAGALEAVHGAGVVHRDMKPNNVLMGSDGAVLIDFGIAHGMEDSRLTATGMVIGTPGYLAPELVSGASPSASTDWWGWAAVLVFAATGRPPFGVGGFEPVIARAMTGKADVNGVDKRIAVALRGALAVRPEHRWSAQEVVAEIAAAAQSPGVEGEFYDPDPDGQATQVVEGAAIPSFAPPVPAPYPDDDDQTRVTPVGPPATAVMPAGQVSGTLPYQQGAPGTVPLPTPHDASAGPSQFTGQPYPEHQFVADAGEYAPVGQDQFNLVEPPLYRRPRLRPRPLIFGTAGLAALALGVRQPFDTLVIVVGVLFVFAIVGATWDAFHTRREDRGATKYEALVTVLWFPWRVIRAVIGIALNLLLAVLIAAPVGLAILWAFQLAQSDSGQTASDGQYFLALAVVWIILLAMLWFGPLPRQTREGGRYLVQLVVPGKIAGAILIVVLVAAVLFGIVTILNGDPIEWHPLQEPLRIP